MKDLYGFTVIPMDSTNACETEKSDLVIIAYCFICMLRLIMEGMDKSLFVMGGGLVQVFVVSEDMFLG